MGEGSPEGDGQMNGLFWIGGALAVICIWNIATCAPSTWRAEAAWVVGAVGGGLLMALAKGAFS